MISGIIFNLLIRELNKRVSGAHIKDITFLKQVISFKLNNFSLNFYLNGETGRIELSKESLDFDKKNLHPFYTFLRKELNKGKIESIYTLNDDRIAITEIEKLTPFGMQRFKFIFEMVGSRVNAYVCNENDEILSLYKNGYGERAFEVGDLYKPYDDSRYSFFDFEYEELPDLTCGLVKIFKNISPFTAKIVENIAKTDGFEKALGYAKEKLLEGRFYICRYGKKKEITFLPCSDEVIFESNSIFDVLDYYYNYLLKKDILEREIKNVRKIVRKELKSKKNTLKKVYAELEKFNSYSVYKIYGDLIFSALYTIKPYSEEFETINYETGEKTVIKLDKNKSAIENGNEYYKKYKKGIRAKDKILIRINELKNNIKYLEETLFFIDTVDDFSSYETIISELREEGIIKKKREKRGRNKNKKKKKLPHIIYDDFLIYYGRSAKENEYLTLKIASNEDLWFHVQKITGSHVVIKTEKKEIPNNVIEFASQLAVWFSKVRGGSKVPVDYTFKKYIRKPKGTPHGFVLYDNFKTIIVDQDNKLISEYLKKGVK